MGWDFLFKETVCPATCMGLPKSIGSHTYCTILHPLKIFACHIETQNEMQQFMFFAGYFLSWILAESWLLDFCSGAPQQEDQTTPFEQSFLKLLTGAFMGYAVVIALPR